ncbi:IclR family transcriptional regulator [Streptosporangium sp. KLBMP 9127]|nr:IclR family transcriptional regulator [Streptosporangium sp. KLBMP 9127]
MPDKPLRRDERAAIDKAMSLLGAFGDQASSGVGVSELARRTGMSKSTAFRLLGMLERNAVVERVGSDYRLGLRLYDLGTRVYAPQSDQLRDALTPCLIDLYEHTRQTVHLATLHGTEVVYLSKLYGHRPHPPTRIGSRAPAHCTGLGKALLAYDAQAVERVLAGSLTALTEHSLSTPAALQAELKQIRDDGIAFDFEESVLGLACVAVPIMGPGGRAVAALSVSGAAGRMDIRAHAALLRRVGHTATAALARARISAAGRGRPAALAGGYPGAVSRRGEIRSSLVE